MNHTARQKKHRRIRARLSGSSERPRASVWRGSRRVVVQIIDDTVGKTLVSVSSPPAEHGITIEEAQEIGRQVAKAAQEKGISKIVFDRGGYKYHGRVKAMAEAMREGGLQF